MNKIPDNKSNSVDKPSSASKNGYRCLTKCHPPKEKYIHPLNFQILHSLHVPTCGIYPIKDVKTGQDIGVDQCQLEEDNELDPFSFIFQMEFNYHDFLVRYYSLNTFDQVIEWTKENKKLPFETIKRIHNVAWKAYGQRIELISDQVFEFYYNILITMWIHDYYQELLKNHQIAIVEGELNITHVERKKKIYETQSEEIRKLLIEKFFPYERFIRLIKNYVSEFANLHKEWFETKSHYGKLKNYIYKDLLNQINK